MFDFRNTKMLQAARASTHDFSAGRQIAFFFLIFGIGMLGQSLLLLPAQIIGAMSSVAFEPVMQDATLTFFEKIVASFGYMQDLPAWVRVVHLFTTVIMLVATVFFCRRVEKRSYTSMGFVAKGAVLEYMAGLGIGLALFALAVGFCVLTGQIEISLVDAPSVPLLVMFFLGFLVQGMSEELLCRSFLMLSLSKGCKLWVCVLTNALLFAALHLFNAGITPLALLNLTLFGVFASVYTLRRGSIWGICAIHSMWNFAQGNVFGISVSGMSQTPSVFTAVLPQNANGIINGGAFGLEGGLAVTVVLLMATVVVLLTKTKACEVV